MECKKCGNKFCSSVVIDGKKRNLSNRKYCLDCSPFGLHNTRQINLLSQKSLEKKTHYCNRCKTEKDVRDFSARKRGGFCSYCKSCFVKLVVEKRRQLKQKAVEYKGGKCNECGYCKCIAALDFHHLDPSQKDFSIGNGSNLRTWSKMKLELDKCMLLCCRCHAEVHAGFIKVLDAKICKI